MKPLSCRTIVLHSVLLPLLTELDITRFYWRKLRMGKTGIEKDSKCI